MLVMVGSNMAINQKDRHQLGRKGEELILRLNGGKPTTHKAPFDIVDFNLGLAYEVKAMSGLGLDLKIHISDSSMSRKRSFARKYGLKALLIAVIIFDPDNIKVYKSRLRQSIRVNQMKETK